MPVTTIALYGITSQLLVFKEDGQRVPTKWCQRFTKLHGITSQIKVIFEENILKRLKKNGLRKKVNELSNDSCLQMDGRGWIFGNRY
jgi:hypothetical protein